MSSSPWPLPASPPLVLLLQPWLELALGVMHERHAAVFQRLQAFAGQRLRFTPRGLPLTFELELAAPPERPALRALAADAPGEAAATVEASLPDLLALLEGRLDGDALFFERALLVEGDMALVLALRNAIEDAEIDLVRDLATLLGPLAPLGERAARDAIALAQRVGRAVEAAQLALLAPLTTRLGRLERDLRRLETRQAARPGPARRAAAEAWQP